MTLLKCLFTVSTIGSWKRQLYGSNIIRKLTLPCTEWAILGSLPLLSNFPFSKIANLFNFLSDGYVIATYQVTATPCRNTKQVPYSAGRFSALFILLFNGNWWIDSKQKKIDSHLSGVIWFLIIFPSSWLIWKWNLEMTHLLHGIHLMFTGSQITSRVRKVF